MSHFRKTSSFARLGDGFCRVVSPGSSFLLSTSRRMERAMRRTPSPEREDVRAKLPSAADIVRATSRVEDMGSFAPPYVRITGTPLTGRFEGSLITRPRNTYRSRADEI